jgi:hypothetical protein
MIVNFIDYQRPATRGEPGRVVPVRALLCAECQTHYATIYRFWIAVGVLSVLAVLATAIASAVLR